MMSRWFAFKRTSSSKGRSHSMRTSIVCTIRKDTRHLLQSENPLMYRSSIASHNGRLSRLSILGIDYVVILSLSLNATIPLTLQWFLNSYFQRLLGQLSALLSEHSTRVSRTYSQPLSICRSAVGVFTVQTHLCLQDLLPTSACRDTPSIPKHVISGNQLTSHLQPMTSQLTCPKVKQKHVSSESRMLKLFDALTLHPQCTNLVITSETLVQSSTQILQKIHENFLPFLVSLFLVNF